MMIYCLPISIVICALGLRIKVPDKSFFSLWPGVGLTKAEVTHNVFVNFLQIDMDIAIPENNFTNLIESLEQK